MATDGDTTTRTEWSRCSTWHPWLRKAEWFITASDALAKHLDPEDIIAIGINANSGMTPTAGVRIETIRSQDEIDDMPGIRRIERRAAELAWHIPATPSFGAEVRAKHDAIATRITWSQPGVAVLVSKKEEDGWRCADMIIMPDRHMMVRDEMLQAGDNIILTYIDRLLGGDRIRSDATIHSATRRGTEIRVVMNAGAIREVAVWK